MKDTPSGKARCGLCGKTKNLIKADCCGNWTCDDEHEYVLFSYARNSCARNHRRYTLCGFHRDNGHKGHWKDCQICRESFETELYVWYGTNEYNFEVLENPPYYEPTRCDQCGITIRLGTDVYSIGPRGTLCERCCNLERLGPPPKPKGKSCQVLRTSNGQRSANSNPDAIEISSAQEQKRWPVKTIVAADDPPPVILRVDGRIGLYVHYDEADAEELRDCLTADEVAFSLDPPGTGHLAQPGKAIFVFGRRHPRVAAEWLELCGEKVVIDPDVVITEDLYGPPVKQLLSLGEPPRDGEQDYAAMGILLNDAPALIRMATDYQLNDGPQDSPIVWSPVHAWRALAQLRVEEAIAPLIDLFSRADDFMDDWVSEDLPRALAKFGAVALAPLTAYLGTSSHGDWSRIAAAKTIGLVGKAQPDMRVDCVARLSAQLERFAEQSETLNAFLISPLMDLRAIAAMPVIERAFASGRVDESVLGDVEDVEIEFGIKTQREHPPKPNALTIMREQFQAQWKAAGLPLPDAHGNFPEPEAESPSSMPYIAPPKIGRNEPCPCGSGKKYKKCCAA